MNSHEFLEPISSRIDSAKAQKDRGMEEISHEIYRRSQLYEEKLRESQEHVNAFEIEQRAAESFAKENGLWIPMDNVFDLGVPGPSGNENDTFVANDIIYKVNNLLNSGGIVKLLKKLILHNRLFPETAYKLHGFAGYEGRSVFPVFMQNLISEATPATKVEIDMFMAALGFHKADDNGRYFNEEIEVWDIVPRNVLKDLQGDLFIVDAELKEITNK